MFTSKLTKKERREDFLESFEDDFDGGQHINLYDYRDNQLQHCCSAIVIGGWNNFNNRELKEFSKDVIRQIKQWEKDYWQEFGVVVTSINAAQRPTMAPILKSLGFKLSAKGIGRHQVMVYLYSRPVRKVK